ncbi:MAG TPA: CHAT domain-containing protein, partial [Saprospiraceae bacterium]|nr:CHAT domain-containing protein [Saprospiraceae bacterium]
FSQQGEAAAAQREWGLAQALGSAGPPGLRFSIWLHQGDALARQAQWSGATDAYRRAEAAIGMGGPLREPVFPYETVQLRAAQARMALLLGRESGKTSHWEMALAQAYTCIDALTALQAQLRAQQSVLEAQGIFDAPYDVAVEAALALGRTELAWQFSERLKSSVMERLNHQAAEWGRIGVPAAWVEAERSRHLRLAHFLRLRGTVEGPRRAFVDDSIRRLSEEGQQFRQRLEREYPSQFQMLCAPQPPAAAEARKHLRPDQSILCYHWGRERAWAFVLRSDTLLAFHLALTDSVRMSVERFFRHCAANPYGVADDLRQQVFREMCTDGLALYRALGAPVEASLTASVLLVPDGLLCVLPFEALLVEADMGAPHRFHRHRFWAAQHHFGYLHSVAAWLQVKSARTWPASHGLLAVAPSFEENPHGLRPLRHNAAEADSVRALRGGEVWKGEAATRTRFE